MTERIIKISRNLYQSLPALYQIIAQIGETSGQVVIVDEQDLPELQEHCPEPELVSPGKNSSEGNTP
jgi:hypothetical protein